MSTKHTSSILMTPGPVPVPPDVLKILAGPIEHHRTPGFQKCLENVLGRLPRFFGTAQRAFLHTSTGSGGMESLLINVLNPGETVAAVVSGKFGERWADMAEAYGAEVERFEVTWGESVDVEKFEAWLIGLGAIGKPPSIVLSQACETSTGALHPVREMARAIRRSSPDALFLVDAITALGAVPLPMDEWDLDGVVGGSQKAFMLPTGLSFVAWSARAWKKIPHARCPRFYFDIRSELESNLRGETGFSSAVPLIRALDHVLGEVESFGGAGYLFQRIEVLAETTRNFCREIGLETLATNPAPSLTAIKTPMGIDGNKWRSLIDSEFGVVLMGGQDSLKGKIIRIGHMGYISDKDHLAALSAIAQSAMKLTPPNASARKDRPEERLAQWQTALSKVESKLGKTPLPWAK